MGMKLQIPRPLAAEATRACTPILEDFALRWEWCGSFRRLRPVVGDFDLALIRPAEKSVEEIQQLSTALVRTLSDVVGQTIQLDMRTISAAQEDYVYCWPALTLYLTGPRIWNVWSRARVLRSGRHLNEYGLWDRDFRKRLSHALTERELLYDSGLPLLGPIAREKWSGWRSGGKGSGPVTGGAPSVCAPRGRGL